MRLTATLILFLLSLPVLAGPIWTYDLRGTINDAQEDSDHFVDIAEGDSFTLRMTVEERERGDYQVTYFGHLGQWLFGEHHARGTYRWGDWAPERFRTNAGPWDKRGKPRLDGGNITAHHYALYLGLFGLENLENKYIPEEDRLVRQGGKINPDKFRRGRVHLYSAVQTGNTGFELDLYGTIHEVTQVPEPPVPVLLLLGLSGLIAVRCCQVRFRSYSEAP